MDDFLEIKGSFIFFYDRGEIKSQQRPSGSAELWLIETDSQ